MISVAFERARAYYRRQRIAGKLNLLSLFLVVVLAANALAVFVSLYLLYASNSALWTLERFESRVGMIERTLLRFRISHDRADALAVRDLLVGANDLLAVMPPGVLNDPDYPDEGGVFVQTRLFADQLSEYLYYHEQASALESSLHKASNDLLASVQVLQSAQLPARQEALVAALIQTVLRARVAQQDYVLSHARDAARQVSDSIRESIRLTGLLRTMAERVEIQIEAYTIAQEAVALGTAFERFSVFAQRKSDNEARMLASAGLIAERVGRASDRQRAMIVRQVALIVVSMLLATVLLIGLGTLLGRRFVRGITRPLGQLVELSGSLARGDYGRRIEVRSPDELGDLAASFNEMAATVQAQIEALRAGEREVLARTAELETVNRALAAANDSAEALNASLEAKVQVRTAELEAANRQLRELTVTDALTGLANRRHFDAVLFDEWARALRSGQPLAVLMIDVDYFKAYNDHYGHLAGDECLRAVSRILRGAARRAGDLVARYGGEEFVVVAVDTDLAAALNLAEALRSAVAATAMPHELSALANGVVTVSIGVAVCVPSMDETSGGLVQLADAALYQAKSGGRNRVASAIAVE